MVKGNNHLPPNAPPRVPATHALAQSLTPATIEQLVENQAKELELRAQELSLQKQEDDHGFEFGKKALEAQIDDRRMQRDHNRLMQRGQYVLVAFLSILVFGIIVTALALNKESIASEIIKAVGYMTAGGFGGYGLRKKEITRQSSDNKNDPS
jgi:hypothetical protein